MHQAPAFEEWTLTQRERLRLCASWGRHMLAEHYAARHMYAPAIECTARLLALEPCQEEGQRMMMALLPLSGRRAEALRQYRVCLWALEEELGVKPDGETVALYERIRTGLRTSSHNPDR